MIYKFIIALNFILILLLLKEENVNLSGFPDDFGKNNYALLFTMTDEDGRTKNLQLMEDSFKDEKLGFKCLKFHNVSSKQIYEKITEYSLETGNEGTLLLYLNSHGGGSGKNFGMVSKDGGFKFSKAVQSIAKSGKVKRLIVLIDTCHASGGIEEGFDKKGAPLRVFNTEVQMPEISKNTFFRNFFDIKNDEIDYCVNLNAFDDAIILASSSPEKLTTRGVFAYNWKKTKDLIGEDAMVADFLKSFAKNGLLLGQQPYFKCIPNNSIFNEPLFKNSIPKDLPVNGKKIKDLILLPDFEIK